MGYYSRGYGALTFSRPLRWSEFRELKHWLPDVEDNRHVLQFDVEESPEETDVGEVLVREALGVYFRDYDECKMYDLLDEMSDLAAFIRGLASVTVTGRLIREGQHSGYEVDVERFTFNGVEFTSEKAVLKWPDGTDVENYYR